MNKGYIHLYTGDGKGKTTAALGLALRAVGAEKKVFIAQFVKGKLYAEINAINKFIPAIKIKQFGLGCFIEKEPTQDDIDAAMQGLTEVENIINSNKYDLIILDEACIALYFKLFSVNALINVIKQKPLALELVITGRKAPQKIIDIADLVTEMKEIKHYYQNGVEAREGIEF